YWPHSQRRAAERSARADGNESRARHQPQNRESARPRCATDAVRTRQRADRMRPRDFIAGVGAMAAAWPRVARAQQLEMPVIGYLSSASPDRTVERLRAFRQGLSES